MRKEKKTCECATINKNYLETQLKNGSQHTLHNQTQVLGSLSQFCQSFFHIRETPEVEMQALCLGKDCSTKLVVCIAVIGDFIGRYTNCKDLEHAEDYLLNDIELFEAIQQSQSKKLQLYMTLQPCHYSSNNKKKSCTENLIRFNKELKKFDVEMELIVGYPYRTHWDVSLMNLKEKERYEQSILSARVGTKMLMESLNCRAFTDKDWEFLISLCDEKVANQVLPLTDQFKSRFLMDQFTANVLDSYSK